MIVCNNSSSDCVSLSPQCLITTMPDTSYFCPLSLLLEQMLCSPPLISLAQIIGFRNQLDWSGQVTGSSLDIEHFVFYVNSLSSDKTQKLRKCTSIGNGISKLYNTSAKDINKVYSEDEIEVTGQIMKKHSSSGLLAKR